MTKRKTKYILLTLIFSTQIPFYTYAMNGGFDPDKDPSRQAQGTRGKKSEQVDPKFNYDLQGQKMLNQQPYNQKVAHQQPIETRRDNAHLPDLNEAAREEKEERLRQAYSQQKGNKGKK